MLDAFKAHCVRVSAGQRLSLWILATVWTVAAGGCGPAPDNASDVEYALAPSSGMMPRIHDPVIAVCMQGRYDASHKTGAANAVKVWLAPLRAIDSKVTSKLVFSCPGDIEINVNVDTGNLRSNTLILPRPVMRLNPADVSTRYANLVVHEMGHALGLSDTYVEGTFKCQAGQPTSVMCNANRPTLTTDDRNGIVAVYRSVFGGSTGTRPSTSTGTTATNWQLGYSVQPNSGGGLLVVIVPTGSKAKKIGFEVGDVIETIDGYAINSTNDYDVVMARTGSSADMTIRSKTGKRGSYRIFATGRVQKLP